MSKNELCPCCKSSRLKKYEIINSVNAKEKLANKDYTNEEEKNYLEIYSILTEEETNLLLELQSSFGTYCSCCECGFNFLDNNDFSKLDFNKLTIVTKDYYLKRISEALNMFLPNTKNVELIKKLYIKKVSTATKYFNETLEIEINSIINNSLNYANYGVYERIQKQIEYYKWMESEKNKKDTCGTYDFCKYCEKSLKNPCASAVNKLKNHQ